MKMPLQTFAITFAETEQNETKVRSGVKDVWEGKESWSCHGPHIMLVTVHSEVKVTCINQKEAQFLPKGHGNFEQKG